MGAILSLISAIHILVSDFLALADIKNKYYLSHIYVATYLQFLLALHFFKPRVFLLYIQYVQS